MSLLQRINSSLVTKLSGSSSGSSASLSSQRSTGLGSAAAQVDLGGGVNNIRIAFSRSFSRMNKALEAVATISEALTNAIDITKELVKVAHQASNSYSQQQRDRLEGRFQKGMKEFREILEKTELKDHNLLDKEELLGLFKDLGINVASSKRLSETISKLAEEDGKIGLRHIINSRRFYKEIIFSKGKSSTEPPAVAPEEGQPQQLLSADLTGNGIADRVMLDANNRIMVEIANVDGDFEQGVELDVGFNPHLMLSGDFNNDGHIDLAAIDQAGASIRVFNGSGDGAYSVNQEINENPSSIVIGSYGTNAEEISGENSLLGLTNWSTPITLADLNYDGIVDLATGDSQAQRIDIFTVDQLGDYSLQNSIEVGVNLTDLNVHDIDEDGKQDFLVSFGNNNVVKVFSEGDEGEYDLAYTTPSKFVSTTVFEGSTTLNRVDQIVVVPQLAQQESNPQPEAPEGDAGNNNEGKGRTIFVRPPRDLHENSVRSRIHAAISVDQISQTLKGLEEDLDSISELFDQMLGAQQFALAGFHVSERIGERINTFSSAAAIAQNLVSEIRKYGRARKLESYGDIDAQLARELLLRPL